MGVSDDVLSNSPWRRGSLPAKADLYYSKAKGWTATHTRPLWAQRVFEYSFYAILLACLYFFLIGRPFWIGAVQGLWNFTHSKSTLEAGTAIFWGMGALLVHFNFPAKQTSLLIPCYKSAAAIGATLEAALKIFPPSNIFVLDNGNSPTPLDDTQSICKKFGVRYFWVSTGSKIVAQFIGCQAAADFPYSLLIDDDCTLPEEFPLRTERIQLGSKKRLVKCLGYAIASVGTGGSKGTMCQQAQDLEYKLSGMGRYFYGHWGSASFPHGAISLWDREFLLLCFRKHPGYTISEDWYFGHIARRLGGRIQMCNEIFVKTETPPACVRSSKQGERAGYGEITVVSQ
ncbi:glycosyltransferase family 2 protein, partial [Melanomma pulvis-pyrius CBS 109.77]